MRTLHGVRCLASAVPRALLLATALFASACTSSGTARPALMEVQPGGFTLTQEAGAGVGARGDFDDALRLLEEERYAAGIDLLREVVEAAPHATAAWINLAIAQRAIGDLEGAEASLAKALALSPRHPAAHNELGIVYRRTGRFDQARESYEKALAVYPDLHFARRNLAILCDLYLGDMSCALEHYELYTQAVPEDAEAAMWIADLRNRVGR